MGRGLQEESSKACETYNKAQTPPAETGKPDLTISRQIPNIDWIAENKPIFIQFSELFKGYQNQKEALNTVLEAYYAEGEKNFFDELRVCKTNEEVGEKLREIGKQRFGIEIIPEGRESILLLNLATYFHQRLTLTKRFNTVAYANLIKQILEKNGN